MKDPTPTVAVIGTGRMGGAMAGTLRRGGFDLVLWNRDRSKADRIGSELDVQVADTAAEAASRAEIVLTSLADDAVVEHVYLGPDGIAGGIRSDAIAIETSTIDPNTVMHIGAAIDAIADGYLDCPVSGSVSSVEQGNLTIMVGGDDGLLERVRPVLDTLAARVIHAGDRGSGAAAKLAVNGLVHGLNIALSEAVVLAERAGVDRATAYEIFASGAGGAPFVAYKRDAYLDPDSTPVAFSLDLVAKDLDLITGLGHRVGAPMRQAETGLAIVNDAIEAGLGDADLSAVAVYLRQEQA
jgi:3-hydroxyisobutyrate dehydrogenase/2-hydroxy-3-oxopropionate reductase